MKVGQDEHIRIDAAKSFLECLIRALLTAAIDLNLLVTNCPNPCGESITDLRHIY